MLDSTNTPADVITVIRINNPFDPRDHTRELYEWPAPKPASFFAPIVTDADLVLSVNGGVVEPDACETTMIRAGDTVVMCPVLRGGGGGGAKNVMRVVALIAVAVFAPELAPALGLTGAAATAVTMATMTAGMLLVNSILPPAIPTADFLGAAATSTTEASYGADGPKNVSRDGAVVPVVYGRYRMGGNLVSARTELDGRDQYLYLLFAMSEGPVASIGDVLINDTPLARFSNVWIQTRLGGPAQPVIDWFNDNESLVPKGLKLSSTSWMSHVTSSEVDRLRLGLVASTGVGVIDRNTGATTPLTINVQAEYRQIGTQEWMPFLPNAAFVVENRPVAPDVVIEVTKKHVTWYETRTRRRKSGKDDWTEETVSYRLDVPNISYTKSIVFKSFKFSDDGTPVKNPEQIAEIRKAIYQHSSQVIADAYEAARRAAQHSGRRGGGGGDREDRNSGGWSGGGGGLGSSDTDNTRGMEGGMVA